MCLTGSLPFSNCCVSSLAAGFRFHLCSMCIPLPRNFNIGCCANEKLLRLIAHRRVRFFTFMFVFNIGLGGRGGARWIYFKLWESIDLGDSWVYLLSIPRVCTHMACASASQLALGSPQRVRVQWLPAVGHLLWLWDWCVADCLPRFSCRPRLATSARASNLGCSWRGRASSLKMSRSPWTPVSRDHGNLNNRIQRAGVQFFDLRAKETCFKKVRK